MFSLRSFLLQKVLFTLPSCLNYSAVYATGGKISKGL